MDKYIDALINVLKKESSFLDDLIMLSKKKTKALTNINLDDINEIVLKEQFIQNKMDNVENDRIKANKEIAKILNIESDDLTVTKIISNISGNKKQELLLLRDEIKRKISEYNEINNFNIDIINNHLNYVDNMLSSIVGEDEKDFLYGQGGKAKKGGGKKAYFDNKA